jgi:hypothetical protein
VLDQLFSIYFIKPRDPDKLALGIHQAVAEVFVFATHGFQHVLGARSERVGQSEKGGRLGAVTIDSCAGTTTTAPTERRGSSVLAGGGELLCESQR